VVRVTALGAHLARERDDGTLLHLAGCWCWRRDRPPLRGPITPGDARVPRRPWWEVFTRGRC
jgi:hypothetical protein